MRIVLCYPVEPRHVDQIQHTAPDAEIVNAGQEGVNDALPEADIFCGHAKVPVDWQRVVARGRLRWIHSSAAGMDHCLVPSVIASDIRVSSSSGLFADPVAEQTMALLLGQLRRIPLFLAQQQRREFVRRPTDDLHGKTVGIVGFGGNGRRIAEILAPYRVRMVATDAYPVDRPSYVQELWPAEALDQLLEASDIVILGLPLNTSTYHLINAGRLAKMRRGAILVNVARGPIVDEAALVDALKRGQLSSAVVDVTEIEPLPADSPLWEMPQVLITPHVGAQSAMRVDDTTNFFCRNLTRYLNQQTIWNEVDKDLGFPKPEHRAPPHWKSSSI